MRVCGGMDPQKLNTNKTSSNTIAYRFSGRMLIYVTFSLFYSKNEVFVAQSHGSARFVQPIPQPLGRAVYDIS